MPAWSTAYYVYCLSGLGFLTVLILSVHRLMWLAYVGQASLGLVYIMALDGDLQSILGLGEGAHNASIIFVGSTLLTYSFCLVAKVSQPDPLVDRWHKPLYVAACISALLPLGLLIAPFGAVHTIVLGLLGLAFLAQALPPLTWGFLPGPLRPRAMPVIQLAMILATIGAMLFASYIEVSDQQWLIARRVTLVCVVTSGVFTMMYMTYIIERMRASSARRALRAAESEAATNKELLEAEREYRRVRELAAHRTEQLSAVSHDLRQPLGSLRATLDGLAAEHSGEVVSQANQALDYLDELAKSFVNDSATSNGAGADGIETIPIELLLQSLEQMFRGEAQRQGVAIRVVHSSLQVRALPVPLMRTLANLIANALKHAECQRLLLGARPEGAMVSIQVLDDGQGLEVQQKLGQTSGSGLGLNIIQALCEQNGFVFSRASVAGAGSRFSIAVPRA